MTIGYLQFVSDRIYDRALRPVTHRHLAARYGRLVAHWLDCASAHAEWEWQTGVESTIESASMAARMAWRHASRAEVRRG